MVAVREGGFGAAFFLQRCEDEFDVLASAQLVACVVRAGAIVVARVLAANGDAIGTLREWIAEALLGKERLHANIFQAESLFAAKLTA